MSLLQEISQKKNAIMEKSSAMEQMFYAHLLGKSTKIDVEEAKLNNIDKIAFNLFNDNKDNVKSLINKEQKADNSFQYHYSKNLIELSVMALADQEFEKGNIQDFLNSADLKEAFILSQISKTVDLTKNYGLNSSIDQLIQQIIIDKDTTKFPANFIEAIQDADELIEIFVIEKCYENLVDFHPEKKSKEKIEFLLNSIDKYNNRIELKIKRQFFIWTFIVLISFVLGISFILPKYWDSKNLEPIVTTSQIGFSILIFIVFLYLLLFHKIEDKVSILKNYIEKKKGKVNKKIGVDLNKIEEIKKEINGE